MKKHILIVSQYFFPEQFRINDLAIEWVKRGYKVTVLTGIPNYPQGKYYEGYGLIKRRKETWNGINIIRIPLIPRGKSALGLIFNYLSFVGTGFFWVCFTRVKADIVFNFQLSPMTQALIGVWYAKRRKIPCYLYVQDLWPDSVESVTGIHSRGVIGALTKLASYIYRSSDRIFATSPAMVDKIKKRVPSAPEKVSYWPQYAEDFYRPCARRMVPEIPEDNRLKIIFTGNIGQAQGLDILPRVAKLLKEDLVTDICFVVVGDGRYKAKLLENIRNYRVEDMFVMIESQSPTRIPLLLAACDIAFISLAENELFADTIPAKLQSYMACGMPILASAAGETERIIRESQGGYCTAIGNAGQLAEAAEALLQAKKRGDRILDTMRENVLAYSRTHFCKDMLIDRMNEWIDGA